MVVLKNSFMRKLLKCLSLLLILSTLADKSEAQPQWKFYVAFEDAIGAKDTLWMV